MRYIVAVAAVFAILVSVGLSQVHVPKPNCAAIIREGYNFTRTHPPTIDNLIHAEQLKTRYEECLKR